MLNREDASVSIFDTTLPTHGLRWSRSVWAGTRLQC